MNTTNITLCPAGMSSLSESRRPQSSPRRHAWRSRALRSAAKSAACGAALWVAALAVPAKAALLTYDFNDGTLQGWTTVSSDPGNSPDPTRFEVNNTYTAQGGSGKSVWVDNNGNRDNAHKTLWIRSPQFKIDQAGSLTFWLLSGTGNGGWPGTLATMPTNASQIPLGVDSTTSGVMGVALRDTATGDFVRTGQKSVSEWNIWEQISMDVSALENDGKTYTLEFFDYLSGKAYSSIGMDTVSIPGTLVPAITGAATASAFTTVYGTASSAQTFAISGANLTDNITATAPAGFEVSSDNGATYDSTATITQSGGNASGTLYVRLAATAPVGTYDSLDIVLSSSGATSVNITTAATGNLVSDVPIPLIFATGTLSAMSTTNGTASAATSFSVSGTNMTEAITVTPPVGLEVSQTSDTSGFGGSGTAITVGSSPGTVGDTTVYVRLADTAAVGTYNSLNIVLSSSGATSVNVTTSASGNTVIAATPVITAEGELSPMSSTYGTASTATSFSVSGAHMTTGITVTPPDGLEVSQTSDTSGFAGSATAITVGAAGTIDPVIIYVRLAATAAVGTYDSKNLVVSSSGATSVNVTTTASGNTVSGTTMTYNFDDGTLQGWTTVASDPGNTPDPESYASVGSQAGITPQEGTKFVMCQPSNTRDNAHKPLWIRSPQFVVDQPGYLTLYLAGGTSMGGYPGNSGTLPTNASQIPLGVDSTSSGLMGVALRDTATGDFVLTAERPGPSDAAWKQIVWDVSALRGNGRTYTVELFDYNSGAAWRFLAMDTVTIPGSTPSADPYTEWSNRTFANGTLSDKDATHDPDGDGMTNQQEFAFGLDPTSGTSANPITQQLDKTTGKFRYTRLAASGLAYHVFTSTDLQTWTEEAYPVNETVTGTVDGVQTLEVTVAATPFNGRLFVRVAAQ